MLFDGTDELDELCDITKPVGDGTMSPDSSWTFLALSSICK